MNPYQRIPGVQNGHIDTEAKFRQMVDGIDLEGLRVLDVGCNLGEMSRLAAAAGAQVHGIDRIEEFVEDAKRLTKGSNPSFSVQDAYYVRGVYDLVIFSAAFHYFQDFRRILRRLARVSTRVRIDVWVAPGESFVAELSRRDLLIPTKPLFSRLAGLEGWTVRDLGEVLSPDRSTRILFELTRPRRIEPKAKVIFGPGGAGKTTKAKRLATHGYEHLQLDQVFSSWKRKQDRHGWSVRAQSTEIKERGEWPEYLDHCRAFLRRWLSSKRSSDVVIEGFSAIDSEYREAILDLLVELGWGQIEQVEMERRPS